MPRMLNEIFEEAVRNNARLEVAGNFRDQQDLGAAVTGCGADFVITGGDGVPQDELGRLLGSRPEVRLVAVRRDGREATLYELKRVPIGDRSPDELLCDLIDFAAGDRT